MFRKISTFLIPLVVASLGAVAGGCSTASTSDGTAAPAWLEAAINDPARAEDRKDDERRHLAATMLFAGVKPGDKVVELAPGGGYWTRVLSRAVGPEGRVYTVWPQELDKYYAKSMAKWQELSRGEYTNVEVLAQPAATLQAPSPADLVLTVLNYHDYYNFGIDVAAFDRSLYAALKPGGTLVVIDHAGAAGSGASATSTLHRIDPAHVKASMQAAGFVLDGESSVLVNSADTHELGVFDKAIRGQTDKFMLRFRRPAR